jgi:hypothetical protein
MDYTGIDPFTGQEVHVARHLRDYKLRRALMQFFGVVQKDGREIAVGGVSDLHSILHRNAIGLLPGFEPCLRIVQCNQLTALPAGTCVNHFHCTHGILQGKRKASNTRKAPDEDDRPTAPPRR